MTNSPSRTRLLMASVAVAVMASVSVASCGNGADDPAAVWCDHLDRLITRAWEYDGGANDGGTPSDMNRIVRDYFREHQDSTDEAMTSLNDALEEAWAAGDRHEGTAAARAWEDSLRDAC